jgi:DDE superfamily endonuclease
VDSSPPYRAEPSFRAAGAAASPHGCRGSDAPDQQTDQGGAHVSPFWHDGTERPIHRPTDPEDQQEYYSGKKKGHTVKNLLVIDETCQICFLSATDEGKANAKILAELEGYRSPPGSYLYQDMGFQGFVLADVTIIQPQKKPRGGELTPPEKATNRRIPSIRIRIEHAIGGVKRYRIVKDKIRRLKDGIRDTIMETCCGLHNYRLQYRLWYYAS